MNPSRSPGAKHDELHWSQYNAMFQAFGWYYFNDCADGKRNKALSTCFSLTPVYPRDKTEMHRGSIYLEENSHIDFSQFLNLSIYLDQSHIDFSPHFQMFLSDFKCSLPKKNRESGHAPLPFWEIFCFLSTEFDFCIFVNDHFAGREERGSGSGEGSQGQLPRSGRACSGQKVRSRNFTFRVWTQGGKEEKWWEFSRLNIASLALASMDMTPVVWRPKEKIEVLNTVASLSGIATETLLWNRIKFNTDWTLSSPNQFTVPL